MTDRLQTVVRPSVPCKCCDGEARIFGVVDFNTTCAKHTAPAQPVGVPIYYHRCRTCGFLFTVAFDDFGPQDFRQWIYNEQYKSVDPDYDDLRPRRASALIAKMFQEYHHLPILDYGCGNGTLASLLREAGFSRVDIYDPFVPQYSTRPSERYDILLSFEVVEHSPHPAKIFDDMDQLLKPNGMILFTTLLQPAQMEQAGVGWWYIGPRNGHVSIFSNDSLHRLAGRRGFNFISFTSDLHVFSRAPFTMRPLRLDEIAKPVEEESRAAGGKS
jgi:2-polyprenyl-6-hydroxyphenyl methylase/3-demethylubiquinone-9 3-methyltransferase